MHDVLRYLIRGGMPNTEANQRLALLAIDANEKGYPDAESYQAELDKQAAAGGQSTAAPPVGATAEDRATAAEAENVRLQALLNARSSGAAAAPAELPAGEPAEESV
jgi:hypothetical protein